MFRFWHFILILAFLSGGACKTTKKKSADAPANTPNNNNCALVAGNCEPAEGLDPRNLPKITGVKASISKTTGAHALTFLYQGATPWDTIHYKICTSSDACSNHLTTIVDVDDAKIEAQEGQMPKNKPFDVQAKFCVWEKNLFGTKHYGKAFSDLEESLKGGYSNFPSGNYPSQGKLFCSKNVYKTTSSLTNPNKAINTDTLVSEQRSYAKLFDDCHTIQNRYIKKILAGSSDRKNIMHCAVYRREAYCDDLVSGKVQTYQYLAQTGELKSMQASANLTADNSCVTTDQIKNIEEEVSKPTPKPSSSPTPTPKPQSNSNNNDDDDDAIKAAQLEAARIAALQAEAKAKEDCLARNQDSDKWEWSEAEKKCLDILDNQNSQEVNEEGDDSRGQICATGANTDNLDKTCKCSEALGYTGTDPNHCQCNVSLFHMVDNTCKKCPTNTEFVAGTGYGQNTCQACPSTRPNWDATTGQCNACTSSTPIWDSVRSQCIQCSNLVTAGTSGGCSACVAHAESVTGASSFTCACSVGYHASSDQKSCEANQAAAVARPDENLVIGLGVATGVAAITWALATYKARSMEEIKADDSNNPGQRQKLLFANTENRSFSSSSSSGFSQESSTKTYYESFKSKLPSYNVKNLRRTQAASFIAAVALGVLTGLAGTGVIGAHLDSGAEPYMEPLVRQANSIELHFYELTHPKL